jgi:drug/metabolite transporter (DMT)-like permease
MALAALAGAMVLWSATFVAMKVALTDFHPVFIAFVRMLVSVGLLLPFFYGWYRKIALERGDLRIIALLVICEPCLYFLFEGYALRYTSASQAGMVTALMPLTVAVCAWFIFKERLGLAAWTGFFLALGGVIWLTLTGEDTAQAPKPMFGNLLEFLAILMATSYTLCVRRLKSYPPFCLTAIQAAGGATFFGILCLCIPSALPATWPAEHPQALPLTWPLSEENLSALIPVLCLFFLAVVTCLAYGLYNIGIARLSAARAAAWINLIPAITLGMGMLFLGDTLTLAQYCSLVPIAVGVILSQLGNR